MLSDQAGSSPEQRRILAVLVVAQVLSGAGLAAGITVGALLAQRMLGTTGLAGMPSALFTLGSALAALVVGAVSQSRGRRAGLGLGYAVGAIGAVGVVVAAAADDVWLLFLALFVYGAGTATNLQARYAGADLAHPSRRGRAISTVLVATTIGGVVGPNLAAATDTAAVGLGLPPLTGPFVLAALAYGAASIVLTALLRPDPLLHSRARQLATGPGTDTTAGSGPAALTAETPANGEVDRSRAVFTGATTMVVTQLVMVAIMTMTPVHILEHGHGVAAAGMIIGIHVAAMYLPSPLSGWIVDRYGSTPAAVLAGGVLLAAGLTAAFAPDASLLALAVALALLGVGWNLGLLSGTTALTSALDPATRARTQGRVDVTVALSGAAAGLGSGFMVATTSYSALALTGGLIGVVALTVAAIAERQRSRRHSTARAAGA
ncbi:MAG TPA: MFS transporter [Pseudonocardia sp.]|nr:MFS transporter [Pseudonocardia sp.]